MEVTATHEAVMTALYDESAGTTRTVDVSKLMARTKLNKEELDAAVKQLRKIDGPITALPRAKHGRLVDSSHGAVALGEAGIVYLQVRGLVRTLTAMAQPPDKRRAGKKRN